MIFSLFFSDVQLFFSVIYHMSHLLKFRAFGLYSECFPPQSPGPQGEKSANGCDLRIHFSEIESF